MGAIAKGWQQYMLQLQLHPLRTKVGFFSFLGFVNFDSISKRVSFVFCDGVLFSLNGFPSFFLWGVNVVGKQAITAGVLTGISDSVAQKLSGIQRLQLRRLLLKVVDMVGFWDDVWFSDRPLGQAFSGLLVISNPRELLVANNFEIFPGGAGTVDIFPLEQYAFPDILWACSRGVLAIREHFTQQSAMKERRPWMQVKTKIKNDYPSMQLTSWTFWPIVGWVNHQYMPLQFRVIFHSVVACCWGIFLNLRARSTALTKG
ncbi:hypothetical protein HHK36_002098 [Tetracentron sinense]|uniref:Uncharacterized protein n=1 Tax=Tetracentron sinense TaxID=13715 RepID=A0A834ZUU5_TETSI|nr:hypothetical protein HHK36_002098 [Tetracentron sinense]